MKIVIFEGKKNIIFSFKKDKISKVFKIYSLSQSDHDYLNFMKRFNFFLYIYFDINDNKCKKRKIIKN